MLPCHEFFISNFIFWPLLLGCSAETMEGTLSPPEITKLCLINFQLVSPNVTKYTTKLDKKILWSKTEVVGLEIRCRITRMEVD